MSKRIFITGCAGFIGFHLAKTLRQQNIEVLGIDNFNDYYDPQLKYDRAQVLKEMGTDILKIDLVDFPALKGAVESFNPTHVVHLAAQAGVRYSLKNPQSYIQSNLVGFANLLEVLKDHPHIKTLFASSSSIYGNNSKVPYSESDVSDQPKNLYGATKKANELMAYSYHSLYHISLLGFRFFTVYGPWGRPDMAYYLFSEAIKSKKPIDVYQGDRIQRDFTYIDDIVSGLISALDCNLGFEIFNLGNHQPVKLTHFIETLEELLGACAIKNILPQAQGDMVVTYADIEKSQRLLNYQPSTDLKTGLQKFTQWLEEYQEKRQKLLK